MSRFIKQTSFTLFVEILALGFGFLTIALIYRSLGPDGLGRIAVYILIPQMLFMFTGLGLNASNIYFLGAKKYSSEEVCATAYVSSFFITVTGLVVFYSLIPVLVPLIYPVDAGNLTPYYISGLFLPAAAISSTNRSILMGKGMINQSNIARITQQISRFIFILPIIFMFRTGLFSRQIALNLLVLASALSFSAQGITGMYYLGIPFRSIRSASKKYFKDGLRYGVKAWLASLSLMANYRLDQLILKGFVNSIAVGNYSVAVYTTELLWRIPNAAAYVLFPRSAMSDKEESKYLVRAVVRHITFITLVSSVLSAIGLAAAAWFIFPLVFSKNITHVLPALILLLPGTIAFAISKIFTSNLAGRGKPQYATMSSTISLVATVALDIILIKRYGIIGAAVAATIAYTIASLIVMWGYFRETSDTMVNVFVIRREDLKLYVTLLRKSLDLIKNGFPNFRK